MFAVNIGGERAKQLVVSAVHGLLELFDLQVNMRGNFLPLISQAMEHAEYLCALRFLHLTLLVPAPF
jgi:hypothetical protein